MNRQRLAELFEQAIDLPDDQRAAWIEAACGADLPLRVELERLLQADARAAAFMERPPSLVAAAIDASTRGDEVLPQFGSWRALRRIGVGGMGEVWLAERSDGQFEQRAAVKQLAWPTPGLLQRFRQERQILARLQHPDIARLIDGGVDDAGAPYLVMEYVEGVPITQYVRDHPLDLRARLRLFVRVCAAVQYAHQNLIVHRDLKPSNIFVAPDGSLKLLDFGIAKVLATTDEAAQTQTAARLLTPDYAAPEQFSGGVITTATDVFALGVVLHELLADARPPRQVASADIKEIAEPPPPSAAGDRTTGSANRRALRGDLDRITLKALAADPQRRYSSAEALGADVQRYLDGQPISVRRDSSWYRFRKFARRNRYALGAAAFVFAVCVAATIVSLHEAQLAHEQAQRATTVRQFLTGVFEQANPDENRGKPITAHQLLEKGEQQLTRETGVHPAIEADIAALLARLYRDIGERQHAGGLLERALAGSSDVRVPDEVRANVLLAVAAAESEDKDSSLAHARQALDLLDASADKDWEQIAEAHRIIALCLIRRGEDNAAIALLEKRIPAHHTQLGARSGALAGEYLLLGSALGNLARFDESETAFTEGTTMLRALYGDDSNRLAEGLNEMGGMLYAKGDLARSEDLHRQVLKIHIDTLGADHHDTLVAEYNLLGVVEKQGHYARALPQRLALLEREEASSEVSPIEKIQVRDAVAIDYRELGRFDEAEASSRQALTKLIAEQGERNAFSSGLMRHLGLTLAYQGRYAEAETQFRNALSIKVQGGSQTSIGACGLRNDIGQILRQQRRFADAIEQLQALTTDACMKGLPDTDPWRPEVLANLSQAQLDSGDAATADTTARQALAYGRKALAGRYQLGFPLFAMARAALANKRPGEAEPLLREALALRSAVHPADDPRILEVDVDLINALNALGKTDEARALAVEVEPLLKASASPYSVELRERVAKN